MNFKHQQSLSLLVDVSSLRAPLTGVGRYVLEILTQLPEQVELRGFNDYRCYESPALNGFLRSFDEPESDSVCHQPPSQSRLRPLAKQALKRVPGSRQLRTRLLDKRIRDCLALNGESVYWQPNFILGKSKAPSIVTVYDLSHVRFPDFQFHSCNAPY